MGEGWRAESSLSEPEGSQDRGRAGRVPRPERRMKKLLPGSVPGVGPCREPLAFECLGSAADHWSSGASQAPGLKTPNQGLQEQVMGPRTLRWPSEQSDLGSRIHSILHSRLPGARRHSAAAGGLAVWMAPGDPLPQPPCAAPGPRSNRALSKQGLIPPPRGSGCRADRGLANQAIARRTDRGRAGEGTGCGGPQGWPLTQVLVAWFWVSRIWSLCNVIPLYLSCRPLAHCPCAPNTYSNSHNSYQTGPIRPCGPL